MKKVFAFVAMMGLLTFGVNQTINAQETEAPATEEVAQDDSASVAAAEENVVEEARLESVYTPKAYPGFESPTFRLID